MGPHDMEMGDLEGAIERCILDEDAGALGAVILPALWRQIGYVMVLYLAGLKAIDPALHEAARVDGASAWQRLWKVTVPQLKGVNAVVLSVIVIDSLRSFDIVWSLTRDEPYLRRLREAGFAASERLVPARTGGRKKHVLIAGVKR